MNVYKSNFIDNNTSPSPFQSKFEYIDKKIESDIDDLEYINSLPKSGFSNYDFLLKNGEKYSKKVESEYVEVLLKGNLRSIFKNQNNVLLKIDDFVVVESEYGIELGRVNELFAKDFTNINKYIFEQSECRKLLRIPDFEELKVFNKKLKDENNVMIKTREIVAKYNFDMKITEAIWQFDRQRLTIYFTAPQRIDFRELVKDLAKIFKARIELRQISSREETKRLGNFVGPCGRELCCTTFMNSFGHVTLEHAKIQQLSNNISKLSGNCSRLKCCIKFEYDTYASAFENFPTIGSIIEYESVTHKIIKIDIFNGIITTFDEQNSQYLQLTNEDYNLLLSKGDIIIKNIKIDNKKSDNFDDELKQLLD